ncbi:Hypothetical protein NTJ_02007 [Nesidiocoris tenuis]|uniref:Uncharacterized protein n=1 Tax=Nesidiocoris tenuis TaxID=355587 RepID=A0ABN7AA54_9HEMI|nr:Hypothetical protein NTJ_02007 [Nesidiocoris tenuis]
MRFYVPARSILSRALLAADTYQKVEKILNCTGLTIGNGMAVNASILLPSTVHREFRCYEVAPKFGQKLVKSAIARCIVQPPKYKLYYHTNKYDSMVAYLPPVSYKKPHDRANFTKLLTTR